MADPVIDIMPGRGKKSILAVLIAAAVITGAVWIAFSLFGITFAFGLQLYFIALVAVLVIPALFAWFKLEKYHLIEALVTSLVITVATEAILVAQGIWLSSTGQLVTVLLTGASITMAVAVFVAAYVMAKFKIEV